MKSGILNITVSSASEQASLISIPMREAFSGWLTDGNPTKYPPEVMLSCLDRTSEYAVQKRISAVDLWEYTQVSAFRPIYNKLLEAKLLRLTDRNTYKVFIVAGQSYFKFLKEKPWIHKMGNAVPSVVEDKRKEPAEQPESLPRSAIDPVDFVSWLTTQKNANGTLFLAQVAKRYASNMRSAPSKLDIPLTGGERNVFAYRTIESFDNLCGFFRSASNYQEVNRNADHGAFSAGLRAYRRYLESLVGQCNNKNEGNKQSMEQVCTAIAEQLNGNVHRVDFSNTVACSGSNPISCSIGGVNIDFAGNWRNLLVAVTEYCIMRFAKKMEKLKSEWVSNYSNTPFLLSRKPLLSGKELSNGYWINVHHSISQLVLIIAGLCRYCGIKLEEVIITYAQKSNMGCKDVMQEETDISSVYVQSLPECVITVLTEDYHNGFVFDTTAIRLLSDKSGVDMDDNIQTALKSVMFRRSDEVYFLPDLVADAETQKEILDLAETWLDDNGCFEISELYTLYLDSLNCKCIDGLENFESFYEFINKRDIRCVAAYGTRIARVQKKSISELSMGIADKVIVIARDEYGGVVSEDDLRSRFPAFSEALLANIIKEYAEGLIKIEINGIVCYQTLDTLGLPDDFSDTLSEALDQLDDLGLTPSEEVLHTALSLRLGVNFKAEYNLPDDKTYRRLVAAYYKKAPKREWKYGIFAEVQT